MNILNKATELLGKYGPQAAGQPPVVGYRMGADLDGPEEKLPLACDCSAFVARCCGQRKMDERARWWGTDRIYDDAQGKHERWRQIAAPVAGCIGVYPGKFVKGKKVAAGHVWVVADPAKGTTIECSSSGKGIAARRRPSWFLPGATGNGRPVIWAEFVGDF